MPDTEREGNYEKRLRVSEERLRLGEIAGGIATFEYEYTSRAWNWSAQAAAIFGLDKEKLDHWEKAVFVDDAQKIRAAVEAANQGANFYVEFRIKHPDDSLHWIAASGEISRESSQECL